jgi:hypothetical protein
VHCGLCAQLVRRVDWGCRSPATPAPVPYSSRDSARAIRSEYSMPSRRSAREPQGGCVPCVRTVSVRATTGHSQQSSNLLVSRHTASRSSRHSL